MAHEKVYGVCENKCFVEVSPKTEVDGKVSKSGDTMTGNLTIEKSVPSVFQKSSNPNVVLSKGFTGYQAIAENKFLDSVGEQIVGTRVDADIKYVRYFISLKNYVDGVASDKRFDFFYYNDGTSSLNLPDNPKSTENSKAVATTAWVNSAPTVVHTTSNENISGQKVFMTGPIIQSTWPNILFKDTDDEIGVAPSQWKRLGGSIIRDKNGVELGTLDMGMYTSGVIYSQMSVVNVDSAGNKVTGAIKVSVSTDGLVYTNAPETRATGYGKTEIATAGWVDNKIKAIPSETWTFTLEDGSTVTKKVLVG